METKEYEASSYKNFGNYDLCSSEKSWCVSLVTSGGNFSETWDKDDEPEIDDLLPSEVMDLIEQRLKSYWISTRRDETLSRIAEWRKNKYEYDYAYLKSKIAQQEREIKRLESALEDVFELMQEAEV